MRVTRAFGHLILALLSASTLGASTASDQTGETSQSSTFSIVLRGVRVGFEAVTVTESAAGWEISSAGRQVAPIDLVTTRFTVFYEKDWQPQRLAIEGVLGGQVLTLSANFNLTTVSVEVMQAGQKGSMLQPVSPRTVVLPNSFYGAYQALAMRLGTASVGTRFPIYVAPQAEINATVNRITDKRLETPTGPIDLKAIDLTFNNPAPLAVEVWIDTHSRLARISVPSQGLVVVRDDLSSVMTREEHIRNPGDSSSFIPSNGFNLGATVTTASGGPGQKHPAVVLVGATGPQDRDEAVAGIPIFGQIAGVLADAGFVVVRYDKRGTGQSGGRTENLTISDYADDVSVIASWLARRNDVDGDSIAVVGYGDGGASALIAADRQKRIKAVALVGAGGFTGREITLEQQRRLLGRLNTSEADKQMKIALQTRIVDAAITGAGWEGVPTDVRRQADTALFRSWLLFDPASTIKNLNQPLLILQGALDTEFPPANADRLETLSRARNKLPGGATTKTMVPGVNHRLVAATTGEVDEYDTLPSRTVAPAVTDALVGWLRGVLPPKKK
ncbi:MAG: alpha/beta hydrolase family protein [Vicinamibacterales bacterium]